MQLLSVNLARVTAITRLVEWDPRSRVFVVDFMRAFVDRYQFQTFPKTTIEYDLVKGAVFGSGRLDDIVINNFNLYNMGVVVDTRSSTDDSDKVLIDMAKWFSTLSGVEFSEERIIRKFYLSQVSFHSNWKLDLINPKMRDFSARLTSVVSKYAGQPVEFETTSVNWHFDQYKSKWAAPMTIDRLQDAGFEEKRYYSSAPLPTEEHLNILADFEKAIGA